MKEKLKTLVLAFSGVIVYSALLIVTQTFIDTPVYAILVADIVAAILGGAYINTVLKGDIILDTPNKKFLIWTLAVIVLYCFVSMFTSNFILKNFYSPSALARFTAASSGGGDTKGYIISCCISIFLAPVVEEMIYRRLLYGTLSQWGHTRALLISSAAFAISHGTMVHLYAALFAGILFCHIYAKSQKLRYPIAAHALFNALTMCITLIPYPDFVNQAWWSVTLNSIFFMAMIMYFDVDASDKQKAKRIEQTEEEKRRREETRRIVDEVMSEYHNNRH